MGIAAVKLEGTDFESFGAQREPAGCADLPAGAAALRSRTFRAFDTTCRMHAQTDDDGLFDAIEELCRHFDLVFSHTNPQSDLVFLNEACGMPVRVNPELALLLEQALDYCSFSDGLFDITAGSLERLWNYHRAQVPDAADVAEALQHVGFGMVHVHNDIVCIDDPEARVVLGGIAKGYIADRICDLMRQRNVGSGVVDLGGGMALVGARPDGLPWKVHVADPFAKGSAVAVLEAADEAVVTSGTYERFFVRDGKAYHHIIDPRTGYPAESDLASVTVVTPRSIDADGYTTALVIMGSARAYDFVANLPGTEALFVCADGRRLATPGLSGRLRWL